MLSAPVGTPAFVARQYMGSKAVWIYFPFKSRQELGAGGRSYSVKPIECMASAPIRPRRVLSVEVMRWPPVRGPEGCTEVSTA